MSMLYAVKHVLRSWPLFIALLLGILLASAFFAGIDIKANVTTEKALVEQLRTVYKDFEILSSSFDLNQLNVIQDQLAGMHEVQGYELISRGQGPSAVVGEETQQTTPNLPRGVYTMVVGITANSRVYDGWSNKPARGLAANETYIARNANFRYGSSEVNVGDVVQMNFTMFNSQNGSTTILPLNLTVAGTRNSTMARTPSYRVPLSTYLHPSAACLQVSFRCRRFLVNPTSWIGRKR
jgi:hypothetical protein